MSTTSLVQFNVYSVQIGYDYAPRTANPGGFCNSELVPWFRRRVISISLGRLVNHTRVRNRRPRIIPNL
jgi:hypothetical protein